MGQQTIVNASGISTGKPYLRIAATCTPTSALTACGCISEGAQGQTLSTSESATSGVLLAASTALADASLKGSWACGGSFLALM